MHISSYTSKTVWKHQAEALMQMKPAAGLETNMQQVIKMQEQWAPQHTTRGSDVLQCLIQKHQWNWTFCAPLKWKAQRRLELLVETNIHLKSALTIIFETLYDIWSRVCETWSKWLLLAFFRKMCYTFQIKRRPCLLRVNQRPWLTKTRHRKKSSFCEFLSQVWRQRTLKTHHAEPVPLLTEFFIHSAGALQEAQTGVKWPSSWRRRRQPCTAAFG